MTYLERQKEFDEIRARLMANNPLLECEILRMERTAKSNADRSMVAAINVDRLDSVKASFVRVRSVG